MFIAPLPWPTNVQHRLDAPPVRIAERLCYCIGSVLAVSTGARAPCSGLCWRV